MAWSFHAIRAMPFQWPRRFDGVEIHEESLHSASRSPW